MCIRFSPAYWVLSNSTHELIANDALSAHARDELGIMALIGACGTLVGGQPFFLLSYVCWLGAPWPWQLPELLGARPAGTSGL